MLKKEYDYSGLDDSSINQSTNPLRNPVLHGFLLNYGRKCLTDTLNQNGIHAEMPKLGKRADVKITMKEEPNGCEIGYLNSYSVNDTVGVSLPKMMAEWTHDGKADKKHSMLFVIDSLEGKIYGIRLEKMREVDPLMEQIRMQENDPERRKELGDVTGKSNWDYFLNGPKMRKKGKALAVTAGRGAPEVPRGSRRRHPARRIGHVQVRTGEGRTAYPLIFRLRRFFIFL